MNELQQLESLLDELLNALQQVISSGEVLSDEFQLLLAQELEQTYNRIEELSSESPADELQPSSVPPTPSNPPLSSPMPSSNIHSFGYDEKSGRLLVKFQGDYPQQNGPIYAYEGVQPVIFDLFRKGSVPARTDGKNKWGRWWKGKVPSLGASLYTLIRNGGYQYQRLN